MPSDTAPDGKDQAESEAEAANRQNSAAEREIDAGFSPPGGKDTQSAGGSGPTGEPHATSKHEAVSVDRSDDDRNRGAEGGMMGEGV